MLRLSDIAQVVRGYADPPSMMMTFNGQRAIGLGISNVRDGNVVKMGQAINQRLLELENLRPIGMELHPISLQPSAGCLLLQ